MSKLGNILKKVGGVAASVASVATKALPGVGNLVSGVLSNVSSRLLASPTPVKQSAAALVAQIPPTPSTPMKASSIALQAGVAAVPISAIKQMSLDLTGQSTPGSSNMMQSSSSLSSLATPVQKPKTIQDIIDNVTGSSKKLGNAAIAGIVIGSLALIAFIVWLFKKKRRR
jgi:hypothetical protein